MYSAQDGFSNDDILFLSQWNEFRQLDKMTHPELMKNPGADYSSLVCPICIQEQVVGYICVDLVLRDYAESDYGKLVIMAACLSKGIRQKYFHNITTQPALDKVMQKLLDHTMVAEKKITEVLQYYGWDIQDRYLCLCLKPIIRTPFLPNMESIAANISKLLKNDFVTIRNESIVLLLNLSKSHQDEYTTLTKLQTCLRDNLLSAGVSDSFSDFKNPYYFYEQARNALMIGSKKRPDQWYFRF